MLQLLPDSIKAQRADLDMEVVPLAVATVVDVTVIILLDATMTAMTDEADTAAVTALMLRP